MIDPKQVTAVLVTKGDIGLSPSLLDSLSIFGRLIIRDNSVIVRRGGADRKVYGRYLAAQVATTDYIYFQDDDCIIDTQRLCEEYQAGELLCNMTEGHIKDYSRYYPGIALVGWGAIFPQSMLDFSAYLAKYPADELFDRECDRVFTWLNREKTRIVDVGVEHLPHAHGGDRMGREARHGADLMEIMRRVKGL